MIRAFLAVELSETLRTELAAIQQELKRRIEPELTRHTRISWTRPASIHLTLKFFGDIDDRMVGPLRTALERMLEDRLPIAVPLERLGAFPHPQNPRVLWIGPSRNWEEGAEAKRAAAIHVSIDQACEGLGFLREAKPFSPHLTLARIKLGERHAGVALAKSGMLDHPLSLGALAVESVALMKSELKPSGAGYTQLWAVPLQG